MKTKLLTLAILCFLSCSLFAQSLATYGEVRKYEQEMTVCSFDSTADAVVLSDFERADIYASSGLKIQRHRRIKILKESGKEQANIVIPYYHGNKIEDITSINAQTINIENGKPVKTSLKSKEFFKVKVDENWSELRFTFPNVKVGSIIEFKYTKTSISYSSFTNWAFQSDIPTLFSQITAYIGKSFSYRIFYQGERLSEKYKEGSHNTWSLTNLQKIRKEPFCPNYQDYVEQINFQCESRITSLGTREIILKTWEEFALDLLNETAFSKILNKDRKVEELVATIVETEDSPIQKVEKIFNYITSNYSWNGYLGIYPDYSLKELLASKSGSSPDLNALLVLLLNNAGLEADPVLISTKKHGFISKNLPFTNQFNNLICNVNIDGKDILMDAARGRRPFDLLPEEDLNLIGFLAHKKKSRWIDIPIKEKTRTFKMVTMDFENPELIKYKYEISSRQYDALDMRNYIKQDGLNNYVLKELIRQHAEVTIDSISTKDLENIDKPTFITTFITDRNLAVVNDDFVYLQPYVDVLDESNLFNEKERFLPIDLYYPFEKGYILNLTVPDDYEVVEIPESMNLKLPGDKGFLKFNSSLNGNKIQLRINLKFTKFFFSPGEYPYLKEIYDLYLEKRQEQIVLKKKT